MNLHFRLARLLARAAFSLPAALGLFATDAAQAGTIDNFADGRFTLEVPAMTVPADGWLRADIAASVPGGWRSLALQPQSGSTALAFIGVDASGLQAYRIQNQQLYVSFGYGQTVPMNLDLRSETALHLDVFWGGVQLGGGVWNADGLTLTVYANTSNGAGLDPNGSAFSTVLRGTQPLDLPFAGFAVNSSTGLGVNWGDVDSLLFVVTESVPGATAAGFGIRSISTIPAVPEPPAWALGALGLAAVAWRRRRNAPAVD
jgi:MYXO-CTERM domain-containing protein